MSNAKGNKWFPGLRLDGSGGWFGPCLSTVKYHLDYHVRDGPFSVNTCIPQQSNMWQGVNLKLHADHMQPTYSENCWFAKMH